MKNLMTACLLAAFLCSASCGCSKDSGGGEDDGGKIAGVTVKPAYNKSQVLHNPLNGWVMYVSADYDPSYFDKEIYVPLLGKNVKVADYASACYIRTKWSVLNPADGEYAWKNPDSKIYKLVQAARERKLPIAFRVVVDGRDQGANTPQFVYDAGAEYAMSEPKYPDRKTPMPQDPVFQRYYEKFVEAFAAEFNDPENTSFIDGYGLGKWGEGHSVAYNKDDVSAVDANTETVKREVLDWITKLYAKYFTQVPLVINYHRVLGHPTSEGTANPDSESLVALSVANGYCLRHDAFGMNNASWGYSTWEKAIAAQWRYKVPIIMEGGYIVSSHSYWNDPAGYRQGHPEDVRQGEFDSSAEAHVNMMDFRVGQETESWFGDAFNLVQRFVSEGGYRLYPDQVTLPDQVNAGSRVKVASRWRNMGWGYFPNNLPQWNYKYKVAYALLDASGKAQRVFVDGECEPSTWVESKPFSYTFETPAVDLPAGKYTWGIAIVDTTKENVPAIELAVNDEKTAEGWVKLLDVQIH